MNQHHFKRISQAVVILALNSLYVACSDSAEFKGQAKNAAASSPSCTVEVTGQKITLGQTIKATLKSSATGVSSSTLNKVNADLGKPVDFTPTSEGVFKIEGALQNSAGSGTCQATVDVGPASMPAPVAPSCSLALTRQSPSSGTCNAVISSTGGPIVGNPSITGSSAMTSTGNGWTTTVPCGVAGATITAQVTGENNVVRSCSKGVAAIPAPNCTISAIRSAASSTSCNVTVTSTGGPVSGNPAISGAGPITATATGWTTSAPCASTGQTITSTLIGANGTGSCNASVPAILAPSCTMTATRQSPSSTTCDVAVTNTGGAVIGNPAITGAGMITAIPTGWTTSATCAAAGQTITSTLTGANGTGSCNSTVPAIPTPVCTINLAYTPEAIGCEINVKNTNSIWWNTAGFDSLVSAFTDSSASWISPPASTTNTQGRLICPKIDQTNQLIFVSHITITQAGNYTVEAIIDDQGTVWLWPEGDPTREIPITPLPIQTKNLTAGNYVVIVKAVDTGAASGMVFSIKNSAGTVIHRTHTVQNRSDSWCIFRTDSTVDPKTFVPEAARCRKCFGAP